MGKFKVGDKVRVLVEDEAITSLGISKGDVGDIENIYDFGDQPIEVYFAVNGVVEDCCFDESELELVNDE